MRDVETNTLAGLSVEQVLTLAELQGAIREGLMAFNGTAFAVAMRG